MFHSEEDAIQSGGLRHPSLDLLGSRAVSPSTAACGPPLGQQAAPASASHCVLLDPPGHLLPELRLVERTGAGTPRGPQLIGAALRLSPRFSMVSPPPPSSLPFTVWCVQGLTFLSAIKAMGLEGPRENETGQGKPIWGPASCEL